METEFNQGRCLARLFVDGKEVPFTNAVLRFEDEFVSESDADNRGKGELRFTPESSANFIIDRKTGQVLISTKPMSYGDYIEAVYGLAVRRCPNVDIGKL